MPKKKGYFSDVELKFNEEVRSKIIRAMRLARIGSAAVVAICLLAIDIAITSKAAAIATVIVWVITTVIEWLVTSVTYKRPTDRLSDDARPLATTAEPKTLDKQTGDR